MESAPFLPGPYEENVVLKRSYCEIYVVLYKAREEKNSCKVIDFQFTMFFIPYSHGIVKYLKREFFD